MVRSFTDEPVDDHALARVLDAATRAPSAGKAQGLDLVVLVGEETARYWSVTLPDPSGFRWQGLLRAPVLVIPVVSPAAYAVRYAEPDKAATGLGDDAAWPVPYWWVDGGMAVEHLLLACVAEGLGACFFGQFDHERVVLDALGVPADRRAVGTIALGHPAPDEPGRSQDRPRRTDTTHRGGWTPLA
ncbi:MAG: putative oxidoreductase [Actinomycetia bacterium]|nr:putative oxidoreductase [Actinomycetes bacterium]